MVGFRNSLAPGSRGLLDRPESIAGVPKTGPVPENLDLGMASRTTVILVDRRLDRGFLPEADIIRRLVMPAECCRVDIKKAYPRSSSDGSTTASQDWIMLSSTTMRSSQRRSELPSSSRSWMI